MAHVFLYGHAARRRRTGYQLLNASTPDTDLQHQVEQYISSLRFRVADLDLGHGWCWTEAGGGQRLFARAQQIESPDQGRTVLVRAMLLDKHECHAIDWNPFALAGVLEEDGRWPTTDDHPLATVEVAEHRCPAPARTTQAPSQTLPWSVFAPCARSVLERWVERLATADRDRFHFLAPAPDQTSTPGLRLIPDRLLNHADSTQRNARAMPNDSHTHRWVTRGRAVSAVLLLLLLGSLAATTHLQGRNAHLRVELGHSYRDLSAAEEQLDRLEDLGRKRDRQIADLQDASERNLQQIRLGLSTVFHAAYPASSTWIPESVFKHHMPQITHYLDEDDGAHGGLPVSERIQLGLAKWKEMEDGQALYKERLEDLSDLEQSAADSRKYFGELRADLRGLINQMNRFPRNEDQMNQIVQDLEVEHERLAGLLDELAKVLVPTKHPADR